MTKRRSRVVKPYTRNVAISRFHSDDVLPFLKLIEGFFDDDSAIEVAQIGVWQAATGYELAMGSNLDRFSTQRQRDDHRELLETLKELRIRLDPLHIPLPLIQSAYGLLDTDNSKPPFLENEIRAVLNRIEYLILLFDHAEILTPTRTNPGKPERDWLIKQIGDIFSEASAMDVGYEICTPDDLRLQRHDFIKAVCGIIDPKMKIPRLS